MIPAVVKPFVPLMRQQLRAKLAEETPEALAAQLTAEIRVDLTPGERGRLAKVLTLTASQLGV